MKLIRGQTALVTGASGGLGEQLARGLASRGVDLVLVARSLDRLECLAAEFRATGVTVVPIVADLSAPGAAETLADDVLVKRSLTIDVLVNNAGVGGFGLFDSQPALRVREQVSVNVAALAELTHALLPPMLARGRGGVLNIASTAAFQPVPQMAVYAATKAFVLSFSEALGYECRSRGVTIAVHCPGPIQTSFAGTAGMNGHALFRRAATPEAVAQDALRAFEAGKVVRFYSFGQFLLTQSLRLTPRRLVVNFAGAMMRKPTPPNE